jgi:hypothetical protein
VPNNTDPPEYTSREITHHIVELFKERLNDTTDVGFRCHCGHKGGVQFTDHQAMTSPVAWALPWRQCERILAAWRAHTKDLDDIHPHAEDQIRDFFSRQRQLEQPGGPTMTRYPLTAIPIDTPKPKSIAISTVVDENLRSIIGDYAKKLGIDVDPMGTAEWDVANGPDRPWYASANVATATAMREYLARLLYGDEGLVENLQADEANINEKLDEVVADLRREEAKQTPKYASIAELSAKTVRDWTEAIHSSDRPTRIILRSYAADDKPRIERLLGLARQLQIPVQLAGPWSCTAFSKGEEAHPALDVVFPEVLVHPRDVLIISDGDEHHDGNGEKRLFSPSLTEAENQILWAAREEDQRFITGLIELLGLHAEASRADIAAAVEQRNTVHPGWMECNAMDDRVRDILGAVYGEETDEAAKRAMSTAKEWRTSILTTLELPSETSINQVVKTIQEHGETNAVTSHHLAECHRQRARYEECDAQVRDILGAAKGEESVDAAKRVIAELVEWKRGQESWKNDATTQRQETAENQRKLLAILNAGTVDPSWQRCLDYAEARKKNAAQFESEVVDAMELPAGTVQGHVVQWAKVLVGQNKYQTGKLAEILGYKSDDYCELLQQVQRVIREHQTLLGERIESNAKIAQLYASRDKVIDERNKAVKDRDALKERLETAITAERQTIAQRIDLALTGNAVATHLDTMLRAVGNSRRDTKILQNFISQIADALDAPSEEKAFTNDDGSLNTALVDRIVGYYKRLYTAAGYSEPPQGGWEELLTHIRKYTGFKPETPVTWPKPQNTDNSKE